MSDSKVTVLTDHTSTDPADLLYIVDDPDGTPLNRKTTVANIAALGTTMNSGAHVCRTVATPVTKFVWKELSFNSAPYDTDDYHSTSINPERLTIPVDGTYLVTGNISWESSVGGRRIIAVSINDYNSVWHEDSTSHSFPTQPLVAILPLSAGDYLKLLGYQGSNTELDILVSYPFSPAFKIQRLS